eukprot:snap_masked-scaffold_46-processed-gene-0.25-mRNA-1 protein AED:1.00 eAED:1.00 QI:0/0/0/0/1/1/2/0/66
MEITQSKRIKKIGEKFKIEIMKPVTIPLSRTEVNTIGEKKLNERKYLQEPTESLLKRAKKTLAYLY